MSCIYNSRSAPFKEPFGAVSVKTPVTFRIRLSHTLGLYAPSLVFYHADEWDAPHVFGMKFIRSDKQANWYGVTVAPEEPNLLFYHFTALSPQGEVAITKGENTEGVIGAASPQFWQLTVFEEVYDEPSFLDGGVMYQIFPDRFCRSKLPDPSLFPERKIHENWEDMPDYLPNEQGKITNSDYFGGDFQGILSKLDYLQGLGVKCLYLNPIFEAHSNHRYNTADYSRPDPFLGTVQDFTQLCEQAKARGMRVILDGVFSHTGDDSIYFNRTGRYDSQGAYQSDESPYYDWYSFQEFPDKYRCWWGFDTLPEVDENNPRYREYLFGEGGILDTWIDRGASGFRLDVADELPDDFIQRLTGKLKERLPGALVLGEVWEDASNKVSYSVRRRYLLGRELDSVMNYPFKDAILDYIKNGTAQQFSDTILTILENYPKRVVDRLMNSISTHDTERALTLLSTDENVPDRVWQASRHHLSEGQLARGIPRLKLAMALQYLLPGVPCIYYGDEAGVYGYRDPFNRCTYPWGHENEELLEYSRRLGELRTRYPGLSHAKFTPILFWENACVFERSWQDGSLLLALNRSEDWARIDFPEQYETAQVVLGDYQHQTKMLAPLSLAVLYRQEAPGAEL